MQHGVDFTGLQRGGQLRREGCGDRAVDHRHFGGDAVHDQFADQIGGAVLAGEIEQRRRRVGAPLGDQPHQVAHVAAGRGDVGEARCARGLGAALADRKQRQIEQRLARRMVGDRARARWRW